MGALPLSFWDLAVAAALVLLAGIISLVLRLDLERRLGIAALRTVVQLITIGYVLEWVFGVNEALPLFAIMAVMITAAGRASIQRSTREFKGAYWRGFVSLALTGIVTTFTVTGLVIGVSPLKAQYVIPLLGMVLGNALTGISLCLDQLLESLHERRHEVEMELSLGASSWEAARRPLSSAVRRGMIPIINSMMVVGLVSLPGMMTGQILAGADPLGAVKYQIVVMFMLAGGTAFGCIIMAMLVYRRLFNQRHQLRFQDIVKRK